MSWLDLKSAVVALAAEALSDEGVLTQQSWAKGGMTRVVLDRAGEMAAAILGREVHYRTASPVLRAIIRQAASASASTGGVPHAAPAKSRASTFVPIDDGRGRGWQARSARRASAKRGGVGVDWLASVTGNAKDSGRQPASRRGLHPTFSSLTLPFLSMYLSDRERRLVSDGLSGHTISDVMDWLLGAIHDDAMSDVFNTPRRKRELAAAVSHLTCQVTGWCSGDHRDPRFTWVVPETVEALGPRARKRAILEAVDRTHPRGRTRPPHAGDGMGYEWMRLVALENIRVLRKINEARKANLMVAMGKMNLALVGDSSLKPWDREYPTLAASLPVESLYAFGPNSVTERLLAQLSATGCSTVGYLAVLHPAVWTFIRRKPDRFWTELTWTLSRAKGE
jgi:hypothetical protein